MVRTLSVTSSPVRPSPRVAARVQRAVAVDQADRHPVDLELAQVVRVVADLARTPAGPRRQLVRGEHVVQAQHPLEMLGRGEAGGEAARRPVGSASRASRSSGWSSSSASSSRSSVSNSRVGDRSARPARSSGTGARGPRRRVPASGGADRHPGRLRTVRPAPFAPRLPWGSPSQAIEGIRHRARGQINSSPPAHLTIGR